MKHLTLHHGSYVDILPTLADNSIDALITDPPYASTDFAWDKKIDWPGFWSQVNRVCKPNACMLLFSAQPFTTDLINSNRANFRYEQIWVKPQGTNFLNANRRPLTAHENILLFAQKRLGATYNPQKTAGKPYKARNANKLCGHYGKWTADFVDNPTGLRHPKTWHLVNYDKKRGYHPTQKPQEIMRYLVQSYTNPGDVVLDTFMGSASTGVACKETGRRFLGIEKDETYYATARVRLGIE